MKSFLKTFKGKVISIGLAIVVVWSAGAVFASTNAGEQLRAWYDDLFNQTVAEIETDTEAYMESRLPELQAEYDQLKEQVGIDIDLSRELATGETLEEIIQAKLEHIGEIDIEQQEILAGIGLEFYNVFLDGYLEIGNNANAALNFATDDLTAYTADRGNVAIEQLTADIGQARDEAVEELEEAIRQAQEMLAAEVAENQEITTRNLMNQVDWTIRDLREDVTQVVTRLADEQKELITVTAQQLGEEAKTALDDVVSSINE
ncbi:hypothetical protein [Oceanobacillus alkalisoli]|uniref:hypothetical protein n=1 Tax=Oceanobacillus alkalisoli TaxID=2925113 RepID=UPI001EEF8991|nr:hypothetical protein [Oceanobacillus alkalisoli]MCF3942131.1 hypothetical protein [Oceanobacillus alkalisoli]MCG5105004.1 hypothetical protein [Oceanobacillus alkalisoli]